MQDPLSDLPPELASKRVITVRQYVAFRGGSERHARRRIANGEIPIVRLSERRIGIPLSFALAEVEPSPAIKASAKDGAHGL